MLLKKRNSFTLDFTKSFSLAKLQNFVTIISGDPQKFHFIKMTNKVKDKSQESGQCTPRSFHNFCFQREKMLKGNNS